MKTLYFYIGEGAKCLNECNVVVSTTIDNAFLGETALGRCIEVEVEDKVFHAIECLSGVEYGGEYVIDHLFNLLGKMFREGVEAAREETRKSLGL